MKKFQSILVPLDGSKPSQRALEQAISIAELYQAHINLLYVLDLNSQVSAFEQVSISGYIPDEIKENGRSILKGALQQIPPTVKAHTFLEIGLPTETIVDFCQENGCDLIIMGSRGLGAVKQLIMGSVSKYVLHHATCPVLITR